MHLPKELEPYSKNEFLVKSRRGDVKCRFFFRNFLSGTIHPWNVCGFYFPFHTKYILESWEPPGESESFSIIKLRKNLLKYSHLNKAETVLFRCLFSFFNKKNAISSKIAPVKWIYSVYISIEKMFMDLTVVGDLVPPPWIISKVEQCFLFLFSQARIHKFLSQLGAVKLNFFRGASPPSSGFSITMLQQYQCGGRP